MTYATPRDTRDVAVLGFVWTHEDHRRKGIARLLLRETLADFRAGGGMAMYLCTTNPNAFALYSEQGFRPCVGDGLRYVAPPLDPDGFDKTYFADAGPARIRDAEWGDLARVSALYNQPRPDWLIKDYPRRVFRDIRYESHYIRVWKPASEGRGFVLVLENPLRRVVGIVSAIETDSFYEQHVSILDFWACPAYLHQLPDLLAAAVHRAADDRIELLQAYIASRDVLKRDLLRSAGFTEEIRLRDRLQLGPDRHDLLIYSLSGPRHEQPAHPLSSYYAARPAFRSGES
jgi:GNAT superfamily N-acetyltransferase